MNILYIATTAKNRSRLDGETVKCKLLEEYLNEIDSINLISVDTDNWKYHIIKLVFKIVFNYFRCQKIVVSSADRGANIVLDFFRKIKCKKDIYYFVIGGSLYKNINSRKWNIETYTKLKRIYVEANTLKENLNSIGINNVKVLNNFRKVSEFGNRYNNDEKIKFVFYSRVIKEKGIEKAIELIKRLNKEGYNCCLDIYGQVSEEYLNELKENFSENIKYESEIKPNSKDEYEILSYYDVFLLPTEYPGECLPGALIDAYISGLAVVVSNWTYAKEYVNDGKNGIIFEYQNYEDMYKRTKEMIDEGKIEQFKQESQKMSENYLVDNLLQEFKIDILK